MTNQEAIPSFDRSIAEYASLVASASPTPGGGSVSGMVGAFAAALASMVCALTLNGSASEERRRIFESKQPKLTEIRERLLDLAIGDEAAYAGFRTVSALPKTNAREKEMRTASLQTALAAAAEASMAIARACLEVLALLPRIAEYGSKHALSDAATSAILASAALRSALLNVDVNADMITDQSVAARLRSESDLLEADGRALSAQTLALIDGR